MLKIVPVSHRLLAIRARVVSASQHRGFIAEKGRLLGKVGKCKSESSRWHIVQAEMQS